MRRRINSAGFRPGGVPAGREAIRRPEIHKKSTCAKLLLKTSGGARSLRGRKHGSRYGRRRVSRKARRRRQCRSIVEEPQRRGWPGAAHNPLGAGGAGEFPRWISGCGRIQRCSWRQERGIVPRTPSTMHTASSPPRALPATRKPHARDPFLLPRRLLVRLRGIGRRERIRCGGRRPAGRGETPGSPRRSAPPAADRRTPSSARRR